MRRQTEGNAEMFRRSLIFVTLIAAVNASAQQSSPPQRTMTARPEMASPDQKAESSQTPNTAAALERFRQAWQKMTPSQQKAFVDAGGYTPQQYERLLTPRGAGFVGGGPGATQNANAARGTASGAGADSAAFESLTKSLQDLNAIRDGNLSLIQKDGCAPEVAARIADLKGKLQGYEFELSGDSPATAAVNARRDDKSGPSDPLALAADWFTRPAAQVPVAARTETAGTGQGKLLDAALSGTGTGAAPERRPDSKPLDAERKRKLIEEDVPRIKAELEQLQGTCATAKK